MTRKAETPSSGGRFHLGDLTNLLCSIFLIPQIPKSDQRRGNDRDSDSDPHQFGGILHFDQFLQEFDTHNQHDHAAEFSLQFIQVVRQHPFRDIDPADEQFVQADSEDEDGGGNEEGVDDLDELDGDGGIRAEGFDHQHDRVDRPERAPGKGGDRGNQQGDDSDKGKITGFFEDDFQG